ncbi:WGR domain-containing protein [Frigidibacter sp.]|uniref:WGR domain-containing protein n=1 Tax=Frigidibacter sp. TaxID=2586418 RepID=UPI002735E2D7|nr:WGR domain-containing protein [Frigidibacter sp.]MDP3339295.1 WGR domain-containing protein [Frigidibacter sp.]
MSAYLCKIDAAGNMARFHHVDLAPNLFGEVCVPRAWGRIGMQGRAMVETCASPAAAQACATRLVRAKLRRGYVAASSRGLWHPELAARPHHTCPFSAFCRNP